MYCSAVSHSVTVAKNILSLMGSTILPFLRENKLSFWCYMVMPWSLVILSITGSHFEEKFNKVCMVG
jgi:hypothetical protein